MPDKTDTDFARMAELRSRKLQLEKEIAVLEEEPKPGSDDGEPGAHH